MNPSIPPSADGTCTFEVVTRYRVTPVKTGDTIDYPVALDDCIRRHVWAQECYTGGGLVKLRGWHVSVKRV